MKKLLLIFSIFTALSITAPVNYSFAATSAAKVTLAENKEINKDAKDVQVEQAHVVEAAEEHAEEDKKKKELVEARNQAEGTIFQIEKALKDFGEKVTDEEKTEVEKNIAELKGLLTSAVKEDIVVGVEKLNNSFHTISQKIYAEQAPPQPTEEQMKQAQAAYEEQQAAQDTEQAV